MSKTDQLIKNAQFRKSLSIAYFNSLNSAIELVKGQELPFDEMAELIKNWRDHFIQEHAEYYAENIAKIGEPFDIKETKKKLEKTKNVSELKKVWLELSEDERQDNEVIKFTNELKKKYEEA